MRLTIDEGEFHDFRRTCLTNWFANGLSEFEVMQLAGHANFETTHRFYLAVSKDLLERARAATPTSSAMGLVARRLRAPSEGQDNGMSSNVTVWKHVL